MDKTLYRVATEDRKEMQGTTKVKMARRNSKERKSWNSKSLDRRQRKAFLEGYILQWLDKALVKR